MFNDLVSLTEKLGYRGNQLQLSNGACVTSLTEFLQDNPGAVEALYQWISDYHCSDTCEDEEEYDLEEDS